MSNHNKKKGKIKRMIDGPDANSVSFGDNSLYDDESDQLQVKSSEDGSGKIKKFFADKLGISFLKNQIPDQDLVKKDINETKDYVYWQMELDLEKYGEQFEKEIERCDKSGVDVRKADENDYSSIAKLYNRAFMRGSDPWSPITETQVKEIMNYRKSFILVAQAHGQDVAFIILDLEGNKDEIGVICGMGTDPSWQRKGYGRYIALIAWRYLKALGVEKLQCEVYENNIPSRKLIESLYFQKYGEKTYEF